MTGMIAPRVHKSSYERHRYHEYVDLHTGTQIALTGLFHQCLKLPKCDMRRLVLDPHLESLESEAPSRVGERLSHINYK